MGDLRVAGVRGAERAEVTDLTQRSRHPEHVQNQKFECSRFQNEELNKYLGYFSVKYAWDFFVHRLFELCVIAWHWLFTARIVSTCPHLQRSFRRCLKPASRLLFGLCLITWIQTNLRATRAFMRKNPVGGMNVSPLTPTLPNFQKPLIYFIQLYSSLF